MPFENATLAQNDHIPSGIIAAITSAQYEHHPFKDGSASLADLMRVMHNIRALSSAEYNACVRAVLESEMASESDARVRRSFEITHTVSISPASMSLSIRWNCSRSSVPPETPASSNTSYLPPCALEKAIPFSR